jgi:hypothetical protein
MITEMQRRLLEFYIYENNDYVSAFEYLKSIGIEKENYIEVIKSVNTW